MPGGCLSTIKRANKGDTDALGDLYGRWGRVMHKIANSVVADDDEAHDIVIDILLKITRLSADRLPTSEPLAWLRRLTRNAAYDCLRSSKKLVLSDCIDRLAACTASRDLGYGWVEFRLVLEDLDVVSRRIVIERLVHGSKHNEIAKMMDLPEASVRRKYGAALKRLRCLL